MTQYNSINRVIEVKNQSKNGATFMKSIFCLLLLFFTLFSYGQEKTSFNVNDSAKDFVVQMINGEKIKLSELKGQVVLLNFWATWCGSCLAEFHVFPSKIVEPFKNSTFVLLPVSSGETMEKVKDKMAQLKKDGVDFNVGIDPDRSILHLYSKNAGVPRNFLIDKKGIIRYISIGYNEEKLNNISSMIKKLLNE
jgi:peroxiredoxin